jgi:hypothetical protein
LASAGDKERDILQALEDVEALKEASPTMEWDIPRYSITSHNIQNPGDFESSFCQPALEAGEDRYPDS